MTASLLAKPRPAQQLSRRSSRPAQQPSTRPGREAPLPEGLGLAQLFLHTHDAAVVANIDTGRIVLWNPAAERLFGYAAAEAVGQPMEMLIPPAIAQLHYEALAHYRRTDDSTLLAADRPLDVPALTRSGDEIRIELSFVAIDDRPAPKRYVMALMRDARYRKQAELQALEAARVEVARAELEHALHEQQQLLAAVLHLRPERTNLVSLVGRAVASARGESQPHRVKVSMPQALTATVDPMRFEQVVQALVDRAMRRNPNGCWIDVDLRRPLPGVARLEVRDYGRPVGDAEQHELLAPTGNPDGLAVTRWIVEQHGGNLTTSSPVDGGLRVILNLPLPRPAAKDGLDPGSGRVFRDLPPARSDHPAA
jgi:PAS domain S-box-containing protein